ncbi:MAG: ABC transporter permease subunit [Lachnospiraceae bacterium]|nr:ABC transporter permease subunit [Lachnospiraceae bacterium]
MKRKRVHKLHMDKGQWQLQAMVLPAMICFLIFSYVPVMGLINAFLDYSITDGFFGHEFVGLKYFKELFSDENFWLSMKNAVGMSALKFFFTFTAPLFLAIFINEVPYKWLKKITQTGSYLPHFLSYVIVATLWMVFLDPNGIINEVLQMLNLTGAPVEFLAEPKYFWWIGVGIDCWQESGWNAIIYLAAIAGINQDLYEAAEVDGAGRWKRLIHITLPSIGWTAGVLFVMNCGSLLSGGPVASNFNQSYLLGNAFNRPTSYVIQKYITDEGLNQMRFSFAAAGNLILSTLSVGLLLTANKILKKVFGRTVF